MSAMDLVRWRRAMSLGLLVTRIWWRYRLHAVRVLRRPTAAARAELSRLHRENAQLIRKAALRHRGVMIKIGQFLSGRRDLLPDEYIQELALLQDQVPPSAFDLIHRRLTDELRQPPEAIFASFSEAPLAAASFGQVHEAVLKDGRRVAVKVQYPGIDALVDMDLNNLRLLTRWLGRRFPTIRFDVLIEEYGRILQDELNYVQEGRYADEFRRHASGDDRIVVPRVYWEYTTPRVLTMEFVDGIKITDVEAMVARGIDRRAVMADLAESYLTQLFRYRLFHGDPHPGNLFVQPGPPGLEPGTTVPRLVFVDFGIMQRITPVIYDGLQRTVRAVIERDVPAVVRGLLALGFLARGVDLPEMEKVVGLFMQRYRDLPVKALRALTVEQIREDLDWAFRVYPYIQLPGHAILFGRTAGLLSGLNARLDPETNLVELAAPHAKRLALEEEGALDRLVSGGRQLGGLLASLPRDLSEFLATAKHEGIPTLMRSEDIAGALRRLHRLIARAVLGAFTLALFGLAAYLHQVGLTMWVGPAGGAGVLAGLLLLRSLLRA